MILDVGMQVGDYRILKRIAKGAYGIVYEAEHTITKRVDAIKLLLDSACSPDEEQRFLREIQVHASLQHPNIAAVHSAFRTPHGLVLAMERVCGESLRTIMERRKIPLAEGLRYILETLSGLDCAERLGVIHRDIKPENILITPDGAVKLTDFGLAHVINGVRLSASGESVGTPLYMAPEQIDGLGKVDERTDVYSTGVVLYELVTGNPPFRGTSGFDVMRAHRETPPVPPREIDPAIPEPLNAVILTALEKNPAKRFQNAAEFYAALKPAVDLGPASMPVAIRTSARHRGLKPHRAAAALLVGFGICGGAVVIG